MHLTGFCHGSDKSGDVPVTLPKFGPGENNFLASFHTLQAYRSMLDNISTHCRPIDCESVTRNNFITLFHSTALMTSVTCATTGQI